VMLTSGIRRLPPQLDTRVLTFELREEHPEVQSKLEHRGKAHAQRGTRDPDPALIAFQRSAPPQRAPNRVKRSVTVKASPLR
jgi:hypothetical protein